MLMAAPRFGKPQSEFGEEIQALESRAFAHGLPCHHHRYQLIEQHVIEFNRLALSKADMRTDDMFNRVMPFDNISSVCLLESRATDSRLVMVNAHIHWDPTYRDVKLVQVAMLVDEVDKIASQSAAQIPVA
jgi:CCR4-NOT transcription complex subunit 6